MRCTPLQKAEQDIERGEKGVARSREEMSTRVDSIERNTIAVRRAMMEAVQGDKRSALRILEEVKTRQESEAC